jgi:hypothetical protein
MAMKTKSSKKAAAVIVRQGPLFNAAIIQKFKQADVDERIEMLDRMIEGSQGDQTPLFLLREMERIHDQQLQDARIGRPITIVIEYGQWSDGEFQVNHEYTQERRREYLVEESARLARQQEDIAARLAKLSPQPQSYAAEPIAMSPEKSP